MTTGKPYLWLDGLCQQRNVSAFNMLSRLDITFLPRSKCLLNSWLQSPSAVILEPKKIKSVTVALFPIFITKWWDQLPWSQFFEHWMLSQIFLLSSFTFIEIFFSSSFSAVSVVSSVYLRLLMFLPPILIPAWNSSCLAFLMMCSAYRLNKQGDSRQLCYTPFSILNQ